MHWTAKMHKDRSWFIIGSKISSLKPLGICLTHIFKGIFHYKKPYYRKVGFYSGLKHFWCIDKNSDVTEMLDKVNDSKTPLILPPSIPKSHMMN